MKKYDIPQAVTAKKGAPIYLLYFLIEDNRLHFVELPLAVKAIEFEMIKTVTLISFTPTASLYCAPLLQCSVKENTLERWECDFIRCAEYVKTKTRT